MGLNPVGSKVDPAVIRIPGDNHVSGTNIPATIKLMPPGYWKFEQVHVIPGNDIFFNRPIFYLQRWHWLIFSL